MVFIILKLPIYSLRTGLIFFIDEIQVSERLIAELKYFCECHPKMNIICAGSLLGVKLNRSRSTFPVGKVKMINLYPMDLEEFLIALDQNMLLDYIKECIMPINKWEKLYMKKL